MIIDLGQPPRQARADYEYSIARTGVNEAVQIIDLDTGNCSVTNDMVAVIYEIWRELAPHKDILEMEITYRDSAGDWDFVSIEPVLDRTNVFEITIRPGFHRQGKGIKQH